jgi:hypothetical protein
VLQKFSPLHSRLSLKPPYFRSPARCRYPHEFVKASENLFFKASRWEHPVFETTLVRAKHSDYQLLVLTERLFARMLRPYIIGMLRAELTKVELNWGKMIWKLWNCYSGSLLEKEILVGQI